MLLNYLMIKNCDNVHFPYQISDRLLQWSMSTMILLSVNLFLGDYSIAFLSLLALLAKISMIWIALVVLTMSLEFESAFLFHSPAQSENLFR